MTAPFKIVDCYVAVREGAPIAGPNFLAQAGFMLPSLTSVRYTYAARIGCDTAEVIVHRPKTSTEYLNLERLRKLGEVAIFARDPQHLAQASHPWEPAPAFDSTAYLRLWQGRVVSVEHSIVEERLTLRAEGWGKVLDERIVTAIYKNQQIQQIVNSLIDDVNSPGGLGLGKDIQTSGRLSFVIDEFDAEGQTVREAIEKLADIAGDRVDWGVNRDRTFFMRYTSTPFHKSGGFLDTAGIEADISEISLERDFRRTRTRLRIFGARVSPTAARPQITLDSTLGQTNFGLRQEDILRDDLKSHWILSVVGQSLLRKMNFAQIRARATIPGDVFYALDAKDLPPIVLRTSRFTPISYASGSKNAPISPMGFSLRVIRASSQAISVGVPGASNIAPPWNFDIVRKANSNPSGTQRFTILSNTKIGGTAGTHPSVRLVRTFDGSVYRMKVEMWSGTPPAGSLVTPIDFSDGAAGDSGTTHAWGVQNDAGGRVELWKDGSIVASATGAPSNTIQASTTIGLGAREDAAADFDDADYQDLGGWNIYRSTTNFLSKLGAHTSAIKRFLGGPSGAPLRVWLPMWEGTGTSPQVRSNVANQTSTAAFVGSVTWQAGLIGEAGGGDLGPPLRSDATWGDGTIFGGSPIVWIEEIDRSWKADSGWTLELEGGLLGPTVGRPIAEIEHRLSTLEAVERNLTGVTTSPALG